MIRGFGNLVNMESFNEIFFTKRSFLERIQSQNPALGFRGTSFYLFSQLSVEEHVEMSAYSRILCF